VSGPGNEAQEVLQSIALINKQEARNSELSMKRLPMAPPLSSIAKVRSLIARFAHELQLNVHSLGGVRRLETLIHVIRQASYQC